MSYRKIRNYRIAFQSIFFLILTLFMFGSTSANEPICIFIDETDYSVVMGKPRLIAAALSDEPSLMGPSNVVTIGVFATENKYEVFAYDSKEYPPVLYRYITTDFIHYLQPEVVFRLPETQSWLGFRSLIKRTDKNEYLLMAAEKIPKEKSGFTNGIYFFKSQDGMTWNPLNNGRAAYQDHDMGGLIWCPTAKQYAVWQITYQFYNKLLPDYTDHFGALRRVISVRTSLDGACWNPSFDVRKKEPFKLNQAVFIPDEQDSPDTQFYGVQLFPYADRFLAAVQIYAPSPQSVNPNQNLEWEKRNRTSPRHGPQGFVEWWVVGDPIDMRQWKRPFREVDLIGNTALNRLRHTPVLFQDKYIEIQANKAYSLPKYRIIGLTSRLNSIIDTHLFTVPAKRLALNASASWHRFKHQDYQRSAYIMAEIRNETGGVIPGYEKEKCMITDQDSQNIQLKWGSRTTAELYGQQVFMRFYFRDATLFSVQENS